MRSLNASDEVVELRLRPWATGLRLRSGGGCAQVRRGGGPRAVLATRPSVVRRLLERREQPWSPKNFDAQASRLQRSVAVCAGLRYRNEW